MNSYYVRLNTGLVLNRFQYGVTFDFKFQTNPFSLTFL